MRPCRCVGHVWGVSAWSHLGKKMKNTANQTGNAHSEGVAEKPSFRGAWRHAQHCVIPVQDFLNSVGALAKQCPPALIGQWRAHGSGAMAGAVPCPHGRNGEQLHHALHQRQRTALDGPLLQTSRRKTHGPDAFIRPFRRLAAGQSQRQCRLLARLACAGLWFFKYLGQVGAVRLLDS